MHAALVAQVAPGRSESEIVAYFGHVIVLVSQNNACYPILVWKRCNGRAPLAAASGSAHGQGRGK